MKIRKKIITLIMTIATIFSIASCGTADTATETISGEDSSESAAVVAANKDYDGLTIRIADNAGQHWLRLALELGFFDDAFAEDGIKVEQVTVNDGAGFVEAIASKQVDLGSFGDQPIISGYASGRNIEIVATWASNSRTNRLLANPDSGITSIEDLAGKKVGYTAGTTTQKLAMILLEAAGLTEDDVEFINLEASSMYTALVAGEIDAGILWGAESIEAMANGMQLITDLEPYAVNLNVLAANTDFAEEYPELVVKYIEVADRTAKWIDENQEEAAAKIAVLTDVSEESASYTVADEDRNVGLLDRDKEGLNQTAEFLYSSGIIERELTTDDFVDTQYLELAGLLD